MTFRTRFAPSPTGPLHLGHAYSALLAYDMAMCEGGDFLLRIEDIDQGRARLAWEAQIYDDLKWLGICWPEPVMRQSDRLGQYRMAIETSALAGLIYPCGCSRADIKEALSAPQEGVAVYGPDGLVYPGTCRPEEGISVKRQWNEGDTLRLDMRAAVTHLGASKSRHGPFTFSFTETGEGPNGETGLIEFTPDALIETIGDVVLARRDMGTSYHLSVVLDDAAQKISHVVRGRDLFEATKIHVVLQQLLGLPTPTYHHHKLIRDEDGKRLAKRDDARAISKYREDGLTPQDIRAMVGL
ncbi:tRNA glutamyl-Q(34) synthetase GluQRS [Litoreibacter janthinus]|uniref:Glutamyl-Q tRNA(Asp) synthetase n=1 Tax=Litoreibacter janthinus TaxID=670154 RepID=A0A1I6H265_9RHOB|nr:tRNA glutamyl-Q(34) synthetase GluQRS [Litoreibacter janthinus]SFR48518.1 glutamyl-Q tRNA(Asp) synthetase [Litoreibacter janthinus]